MTTPGLVPAVKLATGPKAAVADIGCNDIARPPNKRAQRISSPRSLTVEAQGVGWPTSPRWTCAGSANRLRSRNACREVMLDSAV